ncbi:hypothetical protein BTA51_26830 [Hahella sp. CCB-MM4]|uniref:hypothetical protein n=1 Tax=Hahella sp. (strain CCB-MM4) TaxID=1926491 RepID=UPI000B9C2FF8|nr:hypothetical protein [Hahella sp. CCB-MM4]OZG70220.1 hypothetical protein BTA51_26830 [Hahella sp. CCB-MM4]
MKKRIRKIVVNRAPYNWMVEESLWPEGFLKIWIDSQKTRPWLVIKFSLLETVRPSSVASIVRKAQEIKEEIQLTESNVPNCRYENDILTAINESPSY